MRILIVHPSFTIRRAVRGALARAGHTEVLEARSGEQALALQQQYRVGLVILGSDLGPMRGIELARRLRGYAEHRRTPLIMVSDQRLARDVLSAADCGIDNYVLLPFPERLLTEKVDRAVERSRALSDAVAVMARGPAIHQEVFLY